MRRWLLALGLVACGAQTASPEVTPREVLRIPAALEVPAIPDFNPPTPEKVALGRRLFHDPRLSGNRTQSCASCHLQALAFTDGLRVPTGSLGHPHRRNSQGLTNVAYHSTLTWANDGLRTLEAQLPVPLRGDDPIELGITDANVSEILARLEDDPGTAAQFRAAFPESPSGATVEKIVLALATFCRTLVSANSPYDRFVAGDRSALTDSQQRGLALFNGERLECFHCHAGVNFSASYRDAETTEETVTFPFFNTGLYDLDGQGSYPANDQGLHDVTLRGLDRGRFRPPGLRNVALTAPYMHDGSISTLPDVVRHYAAGGRRIDAGPLEGDGRLSPLKSNLVRGFELSAGELEDVVAFLESLTDTDFVTNPEFGPPEE